MRVEYGNGSAIVTDIGAFEPRHIFDNGQCFRWRAQEDGSYSGIAHGRYLNVSKIDGGAKLYPCNPDDFENIWRAYFDFDRDYGALFAGTRDGALLAGQHYAPGLRVLNQQPFETLISFIISANNNITRIRGIIGRLCEKYGAPVEFAGNTYFAFPAPPALAAASEADFKALGLGYRAPYVQKTAQTVSGGFSLNEVVRMSYADAKKALCRLPGVGPKVADCVLLFSLGKTRAFPADVWIKRFLLNEYGFSGNDRQISDFAYQRFGNLAGIAQQYLFYYARENKN